MRNLNQLTALELVSQDRKMTVLFKFLSDLLSGNKQLLVHLRALGLITVCACPHHVSFRIFFIKERDTDE